MLVIHTRRVQKLNQFSVLTTAQMIKFVYLVTSLACNSDREFSQEKLFHILKTHLGRLHENTHTILYHLIKLFIQLLFIWKNAQISVEFYTSLLIGNVFYPLSLHSTPGSCLSHSPMHLLSPLFYSHCPLLYSHLLEGHSFFTFIFILLLDFYPASVIHSASYSIYPRI